MGTGVLIPRIPTDPPLFVATPIDLESTVANDLGVLGTAADGFDAIFNALMQAQADGLAGLSDLDVLLAEADFVDGAFDTTDIAPFSASIADMQAAGDPTVGVIDINPNNEGDAGGRPGPSIVGYELKTGYILVPYRDQVHVFGGTPPFTFTVVKGALPKGLTMDENGAISGTLASVLGAHVSFSVMVTDGAGLSFVQGMELLIIGPLAG